MTRIITALTFIVLALVLFSCTKESTLVVTDDIPDIVPTIIEADTTILIGNQSIDTDKAIIRFEKLIADIDTTAAADCIFSLIVKSDENLSMIVFFEYENTIFEGIKEGVFVSNVVYAYSAEYLQKLDEWNQNGSNPTTKPPFNVVDDLILYDEAILSLEIDYLTEGQVLSTEEYYSPFGVPIQDTITNQPKLIQFIRDACIITIRGAITLPSDEDIEITGYIEAEYHRQI